MTEPREASAHAVQGGPLEEARGTNQRLQIASIENTLSKMTTRNIRKVSFATEKPIYQYVMTEACKRGITAKDLWWEALKTPIPSAAWADTFTKAEVRPADFFRQRHKESGRKPTSVDLPVTLWDEIEEERKALTQEHGEFGPNKLATLLEARILVWALQVSNPESTPHF
jgi:hypothetical protein